MAYRILINREECEVRAAFLQGQELVELHTEKYDDQTIVNNIYRGKVQDVVPGLQAAFVDVGLDRNMFLHFMDIRPESLVLGAANQKEAIREASRTVLPGRIEERGRRPRQDPRAPQAAPPVKRGDDIIVQVMKDEIGGKAPRVTANVSLAGRYLVMLPFPSQEGGVSRKIAEGQDRYRLKKLLSGLKTEDHSFIVRTAGLDQSDEPIRRDAENLHRTWETILARYKEIKGPGLLFNDHDLLVRLVRDAFPSDLSEVLCDAPQDQQLISSMLAELMPECKDRVRLYKGHDNIFEHYGVEKQVDASLVTKFWLKSGGHLIIDENEALTAIDVNSGRFTGKKDQEKTSLKINLEACEAIARQIRLRDIGGIIVIDFIDMLSRSNQEKVAEEMRRQLRHDRAKTALGRIGDFGLLVLTRKRQRMSLQNQVFDPCPYCNGTGLVKKGDEVFRNLKYDLIKLFEKEADISGCVISAHPKLIDELTSRYRPSLEIIRSRYTVDIAWRADPDYHLEDYQLTPVRRSARAGLRVHRDRVTGEEHVLPAIEEIAPMALMESQDMLTAEDSSPQEKLPEDTGAGEAHASAESAEEEGRKRRRRESSAERRARRRRARGKDEDEAEQKADTGSDKQPVGTIEGDTGVKTRPDEVAALEVAESHPDLFHEQDAEEKAPEDEEPRRRTRRGSRGGRKKREQKEAAIQRSASPSASASPASPPVKLTLAVKRKPADEMLGSLLDELETVVSKLEAPATTAEVRKSEQTHSKAAKRAPLITTDQLDMLEKAVKGETSAPRPRRRATSTRKKAAAKDTTKEMPREKVASKEAPKPRRSRRTTKGAGEPAAAGKETPKPAAKARKPTSPATKPKTTKSSSTEAKKGAKKTTRRSGSKTSTGSSEK